MKIILFAIILISLFISIRSQSPDYSLNCNSNCNTCFGKSENECIRCSNSSLVIQNGSCVESCFLGYNTVLKKCINNINVTLNVLNNPVLFEVVMDYKVFGEQFETLSKNYFEILIEDFTLNTDYTFSLQPNLAARNKYSFFIIMQYKQSVRILDHVFMTVYFSLPSEYIKQGHLLQPSGYNFQLHKYQNICDSDQFYNAQTWNCEQKIKVISRLFLTEERNLLQLALNELDFQMLVLIEDYSVIQIQNLDESNFTFLVNGNFFEKKRGGINTPEEFNKAVDDLNDFNIKIDYNNKIIYQKPEISIDFSQMPNSLQTNSKFLLKSNVTVNALIDNFQLSDTHIHLIDWFSDIMAVLNNIVEFLGILCILGYPMSVFPFVFLLQLKYPLMFKFMNIDYPPNVHKFFAHQYAFETKWFYFYKFVKDTLRDLKLISNNFEVYETSPYFLDNTGDKIIRVLILMVICLIMFLLHKLCEKKIITQHPKLQFVIQKFTQLYLIALPLSFILQYFFELTFYMWCSFQFAAIYSTKGVTNFLLSVICFFTINWLLLGLYKIQLKQIVSTRKISLRSQTSVKKISTNIEEPMNEQNEFVQSDYPKSKVVPDTYFGSPQPIGLENQYSIFKHDFALNSNFYTEYFIFLLAVKYYILSFVLALFQDFLAFQISVQCVTILLFGYFNLKYKPYSRNIFNKLSLCFDIHIACYQILLIALIILDFTENPTHQHVDSRMGLGWVMIFLYFVQIIVVLVLFIYFLIQMILTLIQSIKQKSPTTKQIMMEDQNNQLSINQNQEQEKRFNPLSFKVHQASSKNQFTINNQDNIPTIVALNQNTTSLNTQHQLVQNQNAVKSKINTPGWNEQNFNSPNKKETMDNNARSNKVLTSLQLNYLAEKIKKTQGKQLGQDIEMSEGDLHDIEELDLSDERKRGDQYQGQSNQSIVSPGLQRSHFDSPLLKRTQLEEFNSPKKFGF